MHYLKYALITLVAWGAWAIGGKIMAKHLNAVSTTFWITISSMLFMIIYLLIRRNLMINKYIFYGIPVGFVVLIAMLAFYEALRIGPASVVLPFTNLYVLFPVLYGFIVLQESITITRIIGIACAIVACVLLSI
ncbi:MAG: EamA family transporter [candidate division WOR-3 bacterium]|nr:MAG: EamA family transporter [candidate division WOR-3 bacterium]